MSLLASTASTAAYWALALFLVAVGIGVLYAMLRLGQLFDRVSSLVSGAERDALPVAVKAGLTVDRINWQLDKADAVTDSAVDMASSADTAVRAVSYAIAAPVEKVVGPRRRHLPRVLLAAQDEEPGRGVLHCEGGRCSEAAGSARGHPRRWDDTSDLRAARAHAGARAGAPPGACAAARSRAAADTGARAPGRDQRAARAGVVDAAPASAALATRSPHGPLATIDGCERRPSSARAFSRSSRSAATCAVRPGR